jgi:hypothetical protein
MLEPLRVRRLDAHQALLTTSRAYLEKQTGAKLSP